MPIIVAAMFAIGGFLGYVVEDTYNPETPVKIEVRQEQSPLAINFRCENNDMVVPGEVR